MAEPIHIYHTEHFGMPEQPPTPARTEPPTVAELYPCLADAADELLAAVLEMLAYQRGCRGGLSHACRLADKALATAQGATADTDADAIERAKEQARQIARAGGADY